MTKLELQISFPSLQVRCCDEKTAFLLGVDMQRGAPLQEILADDNELTRIQNEINALVHNADAILHDERKEEGEEVVIANDKLSLFRTMNLVFSAPYLNEHASTTAAAAADRSPLDGVFATPLKAIHLCGTLHLACFVHLELAVVGGVRTGTCDDVSNDTTNYVIHLTALEYSRSHREHLLRQEFGAWLLDEHIEKAVIAASAATNKIVYWNRFASELYQYTKEEAMGGDILEVLTPDMTMEQAAEIMSRLTHGQHWKGMFRCKRKDGHKFIAHVIDTPILDPDGNVQFIVGISSDHTEWHNMMARLEVLNSDLEKEVHARTEELLEKERYLRQIGAAVRVGDTGVMITDKDCRVVWSNEAAEEMMNRNLMGVLPWELPLVPEASTSSSSSSSSIGNNDKETMRAFFFEALQLEGHNDQSQDHDSSTCYQTHTTTAIVSVPPEEDNDVVLNGESKYCDTIDDPTVVQVSLQHLLQPNGTTEYMITLRDLTLDRKAEKALLAAELAASSSQTKSDMMRMLSHELRTPLQGIMGAASSLVEDEEAEKETVQDTISMVLASSRLLLTLINNVLDSAKVDSNMMQNIELSPVPVMHVIHESVKFCSPFANINEVSLTIIGDLQEKCAIANTLRLEQVMVNFISNAIKYTKRGTVVEVECRRSSKQDAFREAETAASSDLKFLSNLERPDRKEELDGDALIISVRDHGKGVPEKEFDSIFGEFVQCEISREMDRKYKAGSGGQNAGSGLGLSLSLKFVTNMNGHIWFNNCKEGGGSIFSVSLPCCGDNIGTAIQSAKILQSEMVQSDNTNLSCFRVLVADDSLINLKIIGRMLKQVGVADFGTVMNGREALDYLRSASGRMLAPNLLLIDLQMPVMGGYELATRLSRAYQNIAPKPLLIACSADWTPETELECERSGFDGILRKPISYSDLKAFLLRKLRAEEERFLVERGKTVIPDDLTDGYVTDDEIQLEDSITHRSMATAAIGL